jgi:DNA-binding response OmpR family regulator
MKKVLIIEHEKQLLESTSAFLNDNGFDVIQANEGSDGLQKALQNLPDIILCNKDLPGLNGYEVFKTLKQNKSTATIPFVFYQSVF